MSTKTRFEKEAKSNSEMVYSRKFDGLEPQRGEDISGVVAPEIDPKKFRNRPQISDVRRH